MLGLRSVLIVLASLVPLAARAPQEQPHFDLLVRGGEVIDGTGEVRRRADLGVREHRVVEIGELSNASADVVVEADGLVVAPGFIDGHAHADVDALRRPDAANFLQMGVTTIVTGNCGGSVTDVRAHLDKIAATGIGVNYGTLIGHGTVRNEAMGTANRAPTDAELTAMIALVAQAMDDGAFGMSTGLIYVPGTYARIEELVALSEIVAGKGGLYVSHMRDESDHVIDSLREALEIGERANVPVHVSHLKVAGHPNWGRSAEVCTYLADARAKGRRVTADQYAYTASSTSLDVLFPSAQLEIGRGAFCTRLAQDEAFRARMRAALLDEMERAGFGDFGYAQVASAPGSPSVAGLRIPEIADDLVGGHEREQQADAVIELMARSKGNRIQMVYHKMDEADVERILREPYVAIASDSGIRAVRTADKPHPRGAGNNARVLGHYVRERSVIGLEAAIAKMTSLPATIFGIEGRGRLEPGAWADLVVFDPSQVADRATYAEPTLAPTGILLVCVNGVVAVKDGEITGARAGMVLRHAPAKPGSSR